MFVMTILLLLSASITFSGIEIELNRTIDGKRELYVSGAGCILSSLSCGLGGCMTISLTGVGFKQGCNRLLGFFLIILYSFIFIFEFAITDYIPKVFFGTVLFFNGLNLLWGWLIMPFWSLPKFEYTLLVFTAGTIVILGNNEGLPISIGISALFFAIQYARINSIKAAYTGKEIQSKVHRPYFQRKIIEHYQGGMVVLQLQVSVNFT
jgi:MFS superfamily sulfate permease-like transporter